MFSGFGARTSGSLSQYADASEFSTWTAKSKSYYTEVRGFDQRVVDSHDLVRSEYRMKMKDRLRYKDQNEAFASTHKYFKEKIARGEFDEVVSRVYGSADDLRRGQFMYDIENYYPEILRDTSKMVTGIGLMEEEEPQIIVEGGSEDLLERVFERATTQFAGDMIDSLQKGSLKWMFQIGLVSDWEYMVMVYQQYIYSYYEKIREKLLTEITVRMTKVNVSIDSEDYIGYEYIHEGTTLTFNHDFRSMWVDGTIEYLFNSEGEFTNIIPGPSAKLMANEYDKILMYIYYLEMIDIELGMFTLQSELDPFSQLALIVTMPKYMITKMETVVHHEYMQVMSDILFNIQDKDGQSVTAYEVYLKLERAMYQDARASTSPKIQEKGLSIYYDMKRRDRYENEIETHLSKLGMNLIITSNMKYNNVGKLLIGAEGVGNLKLQGLYDGQYSIDQIYTVGITSGQALMVMSDQYYELRNFDLDPIARELSYIMSGSHYTNFNSVMSSFDQLMDDMENFHDGLVYHGKVSIWDVILLTVVSQVK